jgi:hypothetical protein
VKKNFKLSDLFSLTLVVYLTKSFIVIPTEFDFGVIGLSVLSVVALAFLDKEKITDKGEFEQKLKELDDKHDKKLLELKRAVEHDRLSAETKFSTLNLGIQRQSKSGPNKENYGWTGR